MKFSAWKNNCRVRGAGVPDEVRFADRLSIAELYLARDKALVTPEEVNALAQAMQVPDEVAQEILDAAKRAGEKGIQVHEGHLSPMRRLGQRYCHAVLGIGGGHLRFRCVANAKKKAKEPVLCIDAWDDWFPAAGILAAAVVDNDIVAQWKDSVPLEEMEDFCVSRAEARGVVMRTWFFHHSRDLISLIPHKGSVPVCYAMTRPMVLLSHE